MEVQNDAVMQEDLEAIVNGPTPLAELDGKTVFVTGATGLIGSQIVRALACCNRIKQTNIRVVAFVRSEEKAKRVFGPLLERENMTLCVGDVNQPIVVEEPVDYIIHGASATSSKYFVSNPVETVHTALDGTNHILTFAKEKQVKAMVYLSSLEVYGTPDGSKEFITESDYGYIDPLQARSSYSEGKRMVECLCKAYEAEYGVPVRVARLSQTFGTGVAYDDGRVFAEFARCAMEKKDIVLHTAGNTLRTYCYTKDAIEAILTILVRGEDGEAYNVTNMDTAITIRQMAELVCSLFPESGIQVTVDMPKDLASFGYNPEMVIRLDSSKLEKLGWKATTGLEEMYRRLVRSMQCSKES
ncbi:MAG: NAD-dependent epimerase/dehydratase family protein [Lachnospiraceae bacterium]